MCVNTFKDTYCLLYTYKHIILYPLTIDRIHVYSFSVYTVYFWSTKPWPIDPERSVLYCCTVGDI